MNSLFRPSGKNYLHVNDEQVLKIDKEYISYLKSLAHKDKEKKCTMCLHNDIREHTHEMINVYPPFCYVRPHSHPWKTETKIMIEGKMLVAVFDDHGNMMDKVMMEKDGIFTLRLDKGIIHMGVPLTEVVFHEVTEGPFTGKDDSVFPEWAPLPGDTGGVEQFMGRINVRGQ